MSTEQESLRKTSAVLCKGFETTELEIKCLENYLSNICHTSAGEGVRSRKFFDEKGKYTNILYDEIAWRKTTCKYILEAWLENNGSKSEGYAASKEINRALNGSVSEKDAYEGIMADEHLEALKDTSDMVKEMLNKQSEDFITLIQNLGKFSESYGLGLNANSHIVEYLMKKGDIDKLDCF